MMAENTRIEWADHTFNPWMGCTRVSPACDNCYAAYTVPNTHLTLPTTTIVPPSPPSASHQHPTLLTPSSYTSTTYTST